MVYELIFIISAKTEEKERPTLVEKIESVIKEFGAKVISKIDDGEKKLAYEIKHENVGHYGTIFFEVESEQLKKIEDKLKTFNELLRLQIFRGKSLPEEEKVKEKDVEEEKEKKVEPIKIKEDILKDDILEI
jgi:small subunit ribosomal protein S6